MLREFECYLLSKMPAKHLVIKAIAALGLTDDQLQQSVQYAIDRWSLDTLGYRADVYAEAIGPPLLERDLPESETGSVFAGSTQRLYQLEFWPTLLFSVNRDRQGVAWGEKFVQRYLCRNKLQPSQIRPWECALDAISDVASHVRVLDAWAPEKSIRFEFRLECSTQGFVGDFAYELLQAWKPDGIGN